MDNDWDLFAVVKSCTAAAAAAASSSSTTTPVNNINMSAAEGPFLSCGYMSTFLDDDAPFVFPSLKEDRPDGAFEGLEEFCKEFSIDLALAAAASGITSTTTDTLPVGQVFQQQIQPSLGIHQMQPQHLSLQMQTENPLFGSSLSIRKTNSQPSRPRKRYNFLAFHVSSSKKQHRHHIYLSKDEDEIHLFCTGKISRKWWFK